MSEYQSLIKSLVPIVVGVALVPVVQQIVNDANVTGMTATLVSLIPFFFGLAVFLKAISATGI